MHEIPYADLDLLVQATSSHYRAHILSSPAGQVAAEFALDISTPEFQALISQTWGASGNAQTDAAKRLGGILFSTLFAGELSICLRSSLELAGTHGVGLRIRLRFDAVPELSALPWEYLYDPSLDRFLALSTQTPLVRYLELPKRIRPFPVETPLRILVLDATGDGLPALEAEREWRLIREALRNLEGRKLVELERLSPASLGSLQERLRRHIFHVFHFAGHGSVDPQTGDGALLLANEVGRPRAVTGTEIAMLLHDHASLRLAILNACETAQVLSTNAFAGVAPKLVRQGIPVVIAMQAPLSDRTAVVFTREFYSAVADGYSVDAAVSEARKAVYALGGAEWGVPVIYMRTPDGKVFALQPRLKGSKEMEPEKLAEDALRLLIPFLSQGNAATAQKSGEEVGDTAKILHSSLKTRLHGNPYAEQTLRRFEDQPQSGPRQSALMGILEEMLGEDPVLARDLQNLLAKDQDDGKETISQEITVSGQARTGNIVQIGKVDGNIDLARLSGQR